MNQTIGHMNDNKDVTVHCIGKFFAYDHLEFSWWGNITCNMVL